MYKYMAIRRADIRRMENKDLSRWAQRPKKAEAPARALPKRLDTPADKARMASELLEDPAVQRVMADAEAYDRALDLESDAIQVVGNRRADIGAIADAGVPEAEVQNVLDSLGTLKGGVPMPIMAVNKPGNQQRVHVKYETNPVTGEKQIVPVLDPNLLGSEEAGRDVALVTKYGRHNIDSEAGHQSEPAMMNALKMLGYETNYHDPVDSSGRTRGRADLQGVKNGTERNMDVMFRDLSKPEIEIPLYTMLFPNGGGGAARAEQIVRDQLAQPGYGGKYEKAVEKLLAEGSLNPSPSSPYYEHRMGKIMRGAYGTGDDKYHGLLVPGYKKDVASIRGSIAPQHVPTAPDSVEMINLAKAIESLESGAGGTSAKFGANRGRNRDGAERLQIKPRFAATAESGVTNLSDQFGIIQQLLSDRELRNRLQ